MILAGTLTALAVLILLFKIGIRRVIKYDILIDILATAFLLVQFGDTFAGMMAAIIGGLLISIVLWTAKKTLVREELRLVKTQKPPYREAKWVRTKL